MRHDLLTDFSHNSKVFVALSKQNYPQFGISLEEKEADAFARHLLAPLPVLRELAITDSREISRFCQIPLEAAETQAEILEYYISDGISLSPEEKQLLAQFNITD